MIERLLGTLAIVSMLLACAPAASAPPAQREPAAAAPPSAAPAVASTGPGAPTGAADPLQALVAEARREGALSLVWGEGTAGGTAGVRQMAEAFNREYGLNLDVRFTPGPDFPVMANRMAEEYLAQRPATSDVAMGYSNHMLAMIRAGALESVDWATWAPNVRDPRLVSGGGTSVTFQSALPGITYNSQKFTGDAVPRSLADILKPQYRGHLAATPYAAWFDHLAAPELWGKPRVTEYVTQLAQQASGLMRCNEKERMVSGEFDVLAIDCSQRGTLEMKAQGAPLEFTVASDAPLIALLYVAVPKHSAHPNAAKLWINYLLGRAGQDMLFATASMDSHLVAGSQTVKEIDRLQAAGVKFVQLDVEFYQRNDEKELSDTLAELQRILAKPQ